MIKTFVKKITPSPIRNFVRNLKILTGLSYKTSPKFNKPCTSSPYVLSCIVAYNELGGYCIPQSSVNYPAAQKIMEGVVHEKETIQFITSNYSGDGDIIHAGTYYGDFLPCLSALCSPNAQVWTFEPNLENYRCASITIMINNLTNVNLLNAGLGTHKHEAQMMIKQEKGESVGGTGKIVKDDNNVDPALTQTVPIVSIDDLIPEDRHISMIHLDIEGYEQFALSGALKTIQRCLPILILETQPEKTWFSKYLLSLGYTNKGIVLDKRNQVYEPSGASQKT